ncbi:MAG: hypothetical protein ACM3ZF_17115 [Mycobacterium leprae]
MLAGIAGYAVSAATAPAYVATTSVLFGATAGPGVNNSAVKASQSMTPMFVDLARRQPVLQGAVSDLKLDTTWQELRERVSVTLPVQNRQNPQLMSIVVRAATREEATRTAAAIARRLVALGSNTTDDVARGFVTTRLANLQRKIQAGWAQLAALERATEGSGGGLALQEQRASLEAQIDTWQRDYVSLLDVRAAGMAVVPRVFEPAEALPKPVRPAVVPTTGLAAVVGLLFGIVLLYVLEVRYWVLRSRAEVESVGDNEPNQPRGPVPVRSRSDPAF